MTDSYSTMFGLADFEFPEDAEAKRLREKKALEEAIANEEAETMERSPLRDAMPPDPEPLPSPTDNIGNFLWNATGGVRNLVGGAASATAKAPWSLLGEIAKSTEAAPGIPLEAGGHDQERISQMFKSQGLGAEQKMQTLTGIGDKGQTPFERQARLFGESITPDKRFTAPFTAATYLGKILGPDTSLDSITYDEAQRQGQGAPELPRPSPFQPPDWLSTAIEPGNYSFISPASAEPTVKVQTEGGPVEMKWQDFIGIGAIAAGTAAAIWSPRLIGTFSRGSVPRLRPVIDAVPGTMTSSTVMDYVRTQDDVNAALHRMSVRHGMAPAVADELKDRFRMQTRGNAQAVADSAMIGGRAEIPNFTFQTPIPMADLVQANVPNSSRYLNLRNVFDEINMTDAAIASGRIRNPPPGPTRVQGMAMPDVLQEMHALEQANPQLRRISDGYRQNLRDVRKFEQTGEYGTLSRSERSWENANRPNDTAFTGRRTLDEAPEGEILNNSAKTLGGRIKFRIENEAKGMYVDAMRRLEPSLFMPVTREWLAKHSRAQKNVVEFYRRGKLERYTADPFIADLMKMDPYYMTGAVQQVLYGTKRMLEMGATGALAPWFAVTSFLRSVQIGKLTAPDVFAGARSVGYLRSAVAIPQQLIPQLAQAVSTSLERGSAGWLLRTLGAPNFNGLSTRLAQVYDSSLHAQLQAVGSTKGNILSQQTLARTQLQQAIDSMATGPARTLLNGYMKTLEAVHNAPSFAFASKNYGRVPLSKLALEARHMTGDPRIGGQYYSKGGFFSGAQPIRYSDERTGWRGRVSRTALPIARKYGQLAEIGRSSVPWFNVTTQGIKRIGQAYLNNPAGFTARTWLYTMMPAAAGTLYALSLGKDPSGRRYIDHMFNGRNDYKQTMNYYIPIPGKLAEEGIEFPRFHELAGAARLMENAIRHLVDSSMFTPLEDYGRAAQSFFDVAIQPPLPPALGAYAATLGYTAPQGVFGGEMYKRRNEPFDQSGGLPTNLELLIRALGGGIGDLAGAGAAAFTQTPGGIAAFDKKASNTMKEMGARAVTKTPLLRDALGIHAPMTGNTDVVKEMFEKKREIEALDRYYKQYTQEEDSRGRPAGRMGGLYGPKRPSKSGARVAEQALGPLPPPGNPGFQQPDPVNPLYERFAQAVHDKFSSDATITTAGEKAREKLIERGGSPEEIAKLEAANKTEGIGFKSLMERYTVATRAIQSLNKINAGNQATWYERLSVEQGDQMQYLQDKGVKTSDPVAVKNFYEKQRQDAARVILHTIRSVENDFSKELGVPIKFKDLKPYGQGNEEFNITDY